MAHETQVSASTIDWSRIRHFEAKEFIGQINEHAPRESQLDRLDSRVVFAADQLRERLGTKLLVSPVAGAITRDYEPGSRHQAVGRLSDALDCFVPGSSLTEVYEAALRISLIGGVGLYPDWLPYHGIHIDTRPRSDADRCATWMAVGHHPQIYGAVDWARIG